MEFAVEDVESHSSHVLFAQDSLFGGVLERRNHGLFDFVHVLNSLGDVDNNVGSLIVRSEAPNLDGIVFFPAELFDKSLSSNLNILSLTDFTIFDELR